MKKICLGTDFLVALLRGRKEAFEKAEEYDSIGAEISTTSINAFEIYLDAFKSREVEKKVKQADGLLNSIKIPSLTLESSRKSGEILSRLISIRLPIDLRDAMIAGIILVNGYTLVTGNVEHLHFRRVTG